MTFDPQTAAALLCVALAAGDIVRRAYRLATTGGERGCGAGCGSCPANAAPGPAVVSLDLGRVPR